MKEIKAQTSFNILQNIIPLNAIDTRRDALTTGESVMLFELWKSGEKTQAKPIVPLDCDRTVIASLKYKGYIEYDGAGVGFTRRGKEAIKLIILATEESTFKKKAKR